MFITCIFYYGMHLKLVNIDQDEKNTCNHYLARKGISIDSYSLMHKELKLM